MTAKKHLYTALFALILATLACTINVGGPDYPDTTIPISTEAVEEMKQSIQEALAAGAASGQATILINEIQLTSYLAFKLQEQPEPFLTNPQVYLQDGAIQIYGTAQSGYFLATARIVFTASADANGELVIELSEADFGPLPVPDGLKEAVTAIVSEAYTGALGPVATGFRIEAIVISDGMMAITGRIK
jgi:uncharacterized protein YpmS